MEAWWEERSVTGTDIFSGHRKITFEEDEQQQEDAPFVFGREVDLMLLADNRIVASTASSGRYAVNMPFFARDVWRYAELYENCSADTTPCAILHVRDVALVSGAWLSETGLLLAMIVHGNTKRTLRVLSHCFADDVRLISEPAGIGGLRHDDEPFYRMLCGARRQFYKLMRGAGREISIATRPELHAILTERVHNVCGMLGLSRIALPSEEIPFPCVGKVNVARMSAMLLCLALWLARRAATLLCSDAVEVWEDAVQLCPCFAVSLLTQECADWKEGKLPVEFATAAQLASLDRAIFACEVPDDAQQLLIRFSPLCPQSPELYALRSRPPMENESLT